jgi:hypothetical protein
MGKEKPMIGKILAIGPGSYTTSGQLIPMSVKIGDTVFYPTFGGTKITWEGEEYIISKDADILGVLEEETKLLPHQLEGSIVYEMLRDTEKNINDNDKKNIKSSLDTFRELV